MFDTPLPLPHSSEYARLGVTPDATQEEIRGAVNDAERRLAREKRSAQQELEAVYGQVEGLREAYRERDELLGAEVDADRARQVRERLSALEAKAMGVSPRFRTLRERLERIEDQLKQLSTTPLNRADSRATHDRDHPPLSLVKVEDGARDAFTTEPRVALTLLRREASAFLSRQGETVFHPTDVTRRDFSSDFTYAQLLDGQP